jgi:pseudomonalisin
MKKSLRMISRGVAIAVLVAGHLGWSQSTIQPRDRLRGEITDSDMVRLPGNVHPALAHAVSEAAVNANFPMEHMILLLQPESAQQVALDQLVVQQHDPQSSQYHKFLTPDQYAARFGVSQNDIDRITGWLGQHGFRVEEVTANHLSIVFSGDAYAVQNAFKTEVKQYSLNGEMHHANSSDPQIPAALSDVVKGVVKLHDFHTRSFSQGLRPVGDLSKPLYTASPSTHYLAPGDWATIYNVRPLYSSNLTGTGQSIAVVGRSNVKMSDIQSFRSQFGLPVNNPTVTVAQGTDPGFTSDGDATEATLDVEWAGAIAPQAQVKFVISASTSTADGIDLAAMYAVNHNVAPILSVSFGSCEAEMGTELAFYNTLWQQAVSQGISVFVSAGDSGAAGCDGAGASIGTQRGINGMCSSPYATCVGGTEFKEGSNSGLYWLGGNNPVLGTAQSYIPEVVWNESGTNGGSGLVAGGGGASIQWPKPAWQSGNGVPADGHRDVPDLAVSAAGHDGYLIFYNGALSVVSGTSASSPSLASFFAIINQKYNGSHGNLNPVLYELAIKQGQGGGAVFHDIASGNNSVPGIAGYVAGAGYDLASGLGSIDALQLLNHWGDVSVNATFTLNAAPTSVTVQAGQNASIANVVAVSNGFDWPVALSVSGVPTGVTATFSQSTFPSPGSGNSSLQLASSSFTVAGSYTLIITASGGGISKTATVLLTIAAIVPKCSLTATPAMLSLPLGQATNVRLTCTAQQGSLPTSLAMSVSGQPSGMIAAFSSATLVPGTGTDSLTVNATSAALAGSYNLVITASGGAYSQTINLPVTLAVPPNFALTLASSSVSAVQATATAVIATVSDIGTFSNPTALSLSGLPIGMTGSFSSNTFLAPGAGTSILSLTPSLSTPPGKYTINVVGTGGGLVKSVPLVVTVTAAPSFTLSASASALTVQAASLSGTVVLTVSNLTGNFSAPVSFTVSGLPLNVAFSAPNLAAPGSGSSTLTITALSTVTPGQHLITVTATGGTVAQSANILLTVLAVPGFTLKTDVPSLGVTAGATFTTTLSIVGQNSFNSPVTLTIGTLPTGITASLSSNTISGTTGTAILNIQTASTLAPGSYTISLSGTSPLITTALPSQTTTIHLTVGSVQTTLSAATLTVKRGTSASVTVNEIGTNFTGSVVFTAANLPNGVSASFLPNSVAGSGSTQLTLAVTASAVPNSYTITVRTSAGGTVVTTSLPLAIQ